MAEGDGGQHVYPYNGTPTAHNNVVRQNTASTSNANTNAVSAASATTVNSINRDIIIISAQTQLSVDGHHHPTEVCDLIPNNNRRSVSPYECVKCNIIYHRKLDYVLHVRSSHTNSEKFKCDLCVKICSNYPALMRHKIMAHTAARYT